MDEKEILLALNDNKRDHENYERYFTNDRQKLDKQNDLIAQLSQLSIKLTEQNEYQAKRIEENDKNLQEHIAKPGFWDSANGKKLFTVLLVLGICAAVALFGLNITDMIMSLAQYNITTP